MSQAKQGDTVKVHYTGKLKDGSVFDSSANREPLEFTLGAGNMIPGFEQAVVGMDAGEKKTTEIPVDQAYGQKREDMIISVPRENVPGDIQPEVGQQLAIQQQGGQQVPVTVTEVTEDKVVLDANHPLAGQDLVFEIEVVEVK
jgi:peptidylprolyl isomerase